MPYLNQFFLWQITINLIEFDWKLTKFTLSADKIYTGSWQNLTHLPLDNMAAILAYDIFKWMLLNEMIEFRFKFRGQFFIGVQQAIIG